MIRFKLFNNIFGWLAFLIAAIVYLITMEPTASLWDCGEFIATAFKLEVGHPPGAPLYMILARVFSLLASDVEQVAVMINSLSALSSAFTIMFLYWTITHIARKLILKGSEQSLGEMIAVLGAGMVGALAYTFSDTFWFSAAEAEVYANSSLFTAVVFWAILKWEDQADSPYANRWIILIAYLIGLSIGVHLLNLLAIPAIVFVYYFKKYPVSRKGVIYAALISIVAIGTIMYMIIPGVVKIASVFELVFVNSFGLPYNTGIIIYTILLIGGVVYGLHYTLKHNKVIANTVLLALTVILIAYSSFTMIVIRSVANPPMDENNPEDVFALLSYLNREQYGDRPLFYGEYYNAPVDNKATKVRANYTYIKKDGKYVKSNFRDETGFDSRFETFLPRMWSRQGTHISAYKQWGKVKGKAVSTTNNKGERVKEYVPTFGENLRYMFTYQLGHMYFRYFMWNFAGKQNDQQGHGGILKGNWITGINFIDNKLIGNSSDLTERMKDNPSRNTYYLLPFLLGIFGFLFLLNRNSKDFTVVTLLFVFTGVAIVFYLNQYPYQPRERDYAYAGSYYAFAIWIGLGVLAIYSFLRKKTPAMVSAAAATAIALVLVPGIMVAENWDDHDRSGRYATRDMARNYLNSCEPNALLFTFGDNDTFPLWYAQEVEGIRTDVRVVNMSLLSTDWYINQMRSQAYDSEPIPCSLSRDKYVQGTRDQIFVAERFKDHTDLSRVMDFVASDSPDTKYKINSELSFHYLPAKKLRLSVDKAKVLANGTVAPELADQIVDNIDWTLPRTTILKNEMMMLDILAANKWERPVYFAISAAKDSYIGLEKYFQLEGFAYRLVPLRTTNSDNTIGRIHTDKMYNQFMNEFTWGGIEDPDVFLDFHHMRTFDILNYRTNFSRLGLELILLNKPDSAIRIFDRCQELMPDNKVEYDQFLLSVVKGYYLAGAPEKANVLSRKISDNFLAKLDYYYALEDKAFKALERERSVGIQVVGYLLDLAEQFKQKDMENEIQQRMDKFARRHNLN
jgi:hypothetical protein